MTVRKDRLGKFLDAFLKRTSVKDPSRESLAEPYERGYGLTPQNVVGSLGFPALSFPGATGVQGGPGTRNLEKAQIVYGDITPPGYRKIGGGYTYSGLDEPPSGKLFNSQQS